MTHKNDSDAVIWSQDEYRVTIFVGTVEKGMLFFGVFSFSRIF